MVCMLMYSLRSAIRFGGIGATAPIIGDGTMVGDGIVLTMHGDITRVIGAAGTADIGDIITTIGLLTVGDGAVATIGRTIPIPIAVRMLRADTILLFPAVRTTAVRRYAEPPVCLLEAVFRQDV